MHLPVCDSAADAGGHRAGAQPGGPAQLPVSSERSAAADPRKEVVHGAVCDRTAGRRAPFRLHLY